MQTTRTPDDRFALVALLSSVVAQASRAMTEHYITAEVTLDPEALGISADATGNEILRADFDGLTTQVMRDAFPEASGRTERRALGNLISDIDQQAAVMGVGGDPAFGVAQQDQVAIAAKFIADIGDDAVFRRHHPGAARRRDVDAVIAPPVAQGAKLGDDFASDRP